MTCYTLCELTTAKRTEDLQWQLQGALATGTFVCHLDLIALVACPFGKEEVEEMLFHTFLDFSWLQLRVVALSTLLGILDLDFSKTVLSFYSVLSS